MSDTAPDKKWLASEIWNGIRPAVKVILEDFCLTLLVLFLLIALHLVKKLPFFPEQYKEAFSTAHFYATLALVVVLAVFLILEVVSFRAQHLLKLWGRNLPDDDRQS
jgi:hypothetical protein